MKTRDQHGKNKARMSTSKTRTTPVKAPAKKTTKAVARAVTAKSKTMPKISIKAAPVAKKEQAVVKTDVKATARVATPAARRPVVPPQPKLKLVTVPSDAEAPKKIVTNIAATEPPQEKVRIFQIYYRPEQRQFLDPAFEPYNNEGDNNPLLEFNVFRKLSESSLVSDVDLWGALSWKFKTKTGLTGEKLKHIIAENPGYDLYYCNPYPELEGLYQNLWIQGETTHPNFLILCKEYLLASEVNPQVLNQLVPSKMFVTSNYFVANKRFWRDYLRYIDERLSKAEKALSPTARALIHSPAADSRNLHSGATYLPFIVERLLGVYLSEHKNDYAVFKFPSVAGESRVNVHAKLLSQMKDVAISSASTWMATCWVNYRNLYMQCHYGRDWSTRYLPVITPSSIYF